MGNKVDNKKISELKIDEMLWGIFIVLAFLNISGDELEKKYYTYNDTNEDIRAKKIFTFTVFVSFWIYLYFAYRNYKRVKYLRELNKDCSLDEVRFIGSVLVVTGISLLLYFQVKSSSANNPSVL